MCQNGCPCFHYKQLVCLSGRLMHAGRLTRLRLSPPLLPNHQLCPLLKKSTYGTGHTGHRCHRPQGKQLMNACRRRQKSLPSFGHDQSRFRAERLGRSTAFYPSLDDERAQLRVAGEEGVADVSTGWYHPVAFPFAVLKGGQGHVLSDPATAHALRRESMVHIHDLSALKAKSHTRRWRQ